MLYPLSLRDAVDEYDARQDLPPVGRCECCHEPLTDDDLEAGLVTCQGCERREQQEMTEPEHREAA